MAIHCYGAAYSVQIPLRKFLYLPQHPLSAKRSSTRDGASGSSPYVLRFWVTCSCSGPCLRTYRCYELTWRMQVTAKRQHSQFPSPSLDFYSLCPLSSALSPASWMGEDWCTWSIYTWALILILSILMNFESLHKFLNTSKNRFFWPRLRKACIYVYKHKY